MHEDHDHGQPDATLQVGWPRVGYIEPYQVLSPVELQMKLLPVPRGPSQLPSSWFIHPGLNEAILGLTVSVNRRF